MQIQENIPESPSVNPDYNSREEDDEDFDDDDLAWHSPTTTT